MSPRRLGLVAIVGISVSSMLGSGIFVLPGVAVAKAGNALWLAYLLAGICVLPTALSKSELATAMPTAGGTYVFLERTFGPLAGTIAGLGLWLSLLLKSAFALVGFGAYLALLGDVPIRPVSLAFLLCIIALNIRGVGKVSAVQLSVVSVATAALLALGLPAARASQWDTMGPLLSHGPGGLAAAVGLVFIAFSGVTKVAAVADEVKDPGRNLPRGILWSLGVVTVLYVLLTYGMIGVIGADALSGDLHPIYTLAKGVFGRPEIHWFVAVLGVITMTSMANAGLLASSRFPFAMARDQLLPPILGRLHPVLLTPRASIWMTGGLMAAVIMVLDVERIAKLASAFMIAAYMGVNLAVVVLREFGVQWYKPVYRSPLYPWPQAAGIVTGAVLLVMLGWQPALALLAVVAVGFGLWLSYGRRRVSRQGILMQRTARPDLVPQHGADAGQGDVTRSAVVVGLFGHERSPETLLELAEALAEGDPITVSQLTEVPEQTILGTLDEDDVHTENIGRRMRAMAEERGIEVHHQELLSHDILHTVHTLTGKTACRWLVMGWGGWRPYALTVHNPIGWLKDHLSANLAVFQDAGVRYFRRILVHLEPGPHDALVVGTADRLARIHKSELTLIRYVGVNASKATIAAQLDYLDEVRQLCATGAQVEILTGGDEAAALASSSTSYDLLITTGTPEVHWLRQVRGSRVDRILRRARCSVLALQAPRGLMAPAFSTYRSKQPVRSELLSALGPVVMNIKVRSKEALFDAIASRMTEVLDGVDATAIASALWQRERAQNTAVGDGLALPHATMPEVTDTVLGVFVASEPVPYDSPDGQAVDVCIVSVGGPSTRQEHLLYLAKVARMVTDGELLRRIRAAPDAEAVREVVRAMEARMG